MATGCRQPEPVADLDDAELRSDQSVSTSPGLGLSNITVLGGNRSAHPLGVRFMSRLAILREHQVDELSAAQQSAGSRFAPQYRHHA